MAVGVGSTWIVGLSEWTVIYMGTKVSAV